MLVLGASLSFPPKPIGVQPAPVRMTLAIFADQDPEAHARAPVTLIAQLVQADDFGFDIGLRSGGSGWNRCAEQSAQNSCRGQD
jgi:hypothetical protein